MTGYDETFTLIERLSSVDAVSTDEGDLRALIKDRLAGLFDSVEEDALGNLILSRSGDEPPKTLFAYMDEPGLVVTHVDKDGMLHVAAAGDVSAKEAPGCRVRFKNGMSGIVVAAGKNQDSADVASLRIDVGATSREEAERLVRVGARAAFDVAIVRQGDAVVGKALESRAGCAALIQALERSQARGLRAVFVAQERLGGRGLAALASGDRSFGEAVGVSLVDASPGAKESTAVKIGAGPCLVVQDGAHVGDEAVVEALGAAAEKDGIAVQRCVSKGGPKGAGILQRAPGGVSLAVLGIPARNASGLAQIVHLGDVAAAAKILGRWADGE